jgi:hypothetical protein
MDSFRVNKKTNDLMPPHQLIKLVHYELGFGLQPYILKNKFLYRGGIVDGVRHGFGKLFYGDRIFWNSGVNLLPNDNIFDMKDGLGDSDTSPKFIYEGNFLCDAIHSENAKIFNVNANLFYEGPVFLGKKVGYGVLYHLNGIKYIFTGINCFR